MVTTTQNELYRSNLDTLASKMFREDMEYTMSVVGIHRDLENDFQSYCTANIPRASELGIGDAHNDADAIAASMIQDDFKTIAGYFESCVAGASHRDILCTQLRLFYSCGEDHTLDNSCCVGSEPPVNEIEVRFDGRRNKIIGSGMTESSDEAFELRRSKRKSKIMKLIRRKALVCSTSRKVKSLI